MLKTMTSNMIVDLNVLGAFMEYRVVSNLNSTCYNGTLELV